MDEVRLARICRYRRAGLSLDTIRALLDAVDAGGPTASGSADPDERDDRDDPSDDRDDPSDDRDDPDHPGDRDGPSDDRDDVWCDALTERLVRIAEQIRELNDQRRFILLCLAEGRGLRGFPFLTAERFVEMLDEAGMGEETRAAWHAAFERADGDEHQAFLELLCLPDDAIATIRGQSAR